VRSWSAFALVGGERVVTQRRLCPHSAGCRDQSPQQQCQPQQGATPGHAAALAGVLMGSCSWRPGGGGFYGCMMLMPELCHTACRKAGSSMPLLLVSITCQCAGQVLNTWKKLATAIRQGHWGDRGVPSCRLAVSRGGAYIPSTKVLATPRGEPSSEGYHVSLTESNTDAFRHL
jgi:hypothetical protein